MIVTPAISSIEFEGKDPVSFYPCQFEHPYMDDAKKQDSGIWRRTQWLNPSVDSLVSSEIIDVTSVWAEKSEKTPRSGCGNSCITYPARITQHPTMHLRLNETCRSTIKPRSLVLESTNQRIAKDKTINRRHLAERSAENPPFFPTATLKERAGGL